MNKPKEDRRLTRLTKICLALPEATRQVVGRHAGFYVRKKRKGCGAHHNTCQELLRAALRFARVPQKTFAYFLDDHHGDSIVGISCKVLPGDNTALIAADPTRFYMPAYVGSKGWVGLRLDVGEIDWEEVAELVRSSYRLVAPKRLAAQVKVEQ